MAKIKQADIHAPSTVTDHTERWILIGSIAFILFGAGLLVTLRLLGLK